jgi:hypothetical protein
MPAGAKHDTKSSSGAKKVSGFCVLGIYINYGKPDWIGAAHQR